MKIGFLSWFCNENANKRPFDALKHVYVLIQISFFCTFLNGISSLGWNLCIYAEFPSL